MGGADYLHNRGKFVCGRGKFVGHNDKADVTREFTYALSIVT
jgi:hypothetical protein